ncbi:phage tail protein [Photorhabdus sp. SF281]|uniref:phage tail protein n=1 Tax=Photorhabdus sp. SF281 TaxID=3459527 RepID=UPI00404448C3
MSIINKPDYKVFAQDAKSGEIETFPDVLRGWGVTLDRTAGKPPLEWFNSAGKRVDEWLMYLSQRGLAEWDTTVDYPQYAAVQHSMKFYVALKQNISQQPDRSQNNWQLMTDFLGAPKSVLDALNTKQDKGDYATNTQLNSVSTELNKSISAANTSATNANNNANTKLSKSQNGADIPDKNAFVKNLGLVETVSKANNAVPGSRKVNGKVLTGDVSLNAGDVGAYSKPESDSRFIQLNTNTKTSGYILTKTANYFDDPNSRNLGRSGFLRPNGLDNLGDLAIHIAHPGSDGPSWARGISFSYGNDYGNFDISTYAFDGDGKFKGKKRILTEDDVNTPVGPPIPWPQPNPPSGYLTCNGQAFNKSLYPQLAAAYPSGTLPDLRGEFIRGWDDGRGVDSGRGILSYQEGQAPVSAIKGYWDNNWNNGTRRDTGFSAATGTNNGSFHTIIQEYENQRETRPRNIAFNYIVRAA